MINSIYKTTALALSLALVAAAYAGDNAGATFGLAHLDEVSGVGPGETVTVQIAASGLVARPPRSQPSGRPRRRRRDRAP